MVKAFEATGVEHRGVHALRHSFARNLYARGVEVKIISKLLDHASVEITYSRYIHFLKARSTTPYAGSGSWGEKKDGKPCTR